MIPRFDIETAATRISSYVRKTPVVSLEDGAFDSRAKLTLKLESLQHASSFKPRGAFNRILASEVKGGRGDRRQPTISSPEITSEAEREDRSGLLW